MKYYNILQQNEDVLKYKDLIEKAIDNMNLLINHFKEEYDYAFYNMNMLYYIVYIPKVMDKITKPFVFDEERKFKVINFNKDSFIKDIEENFLKIKQNNENEIRLFSEEEIYREINSVNDIFFSVMNK